MIGPAAVLLSKFTRKRLKETSVIKEEAGSYLSEPCLSLLPGRAEGREAGSVDATGLTALYENVAKRPIHSEPRKASSGQQRKALCWRSAQVFYCEYLVVLNRAG